MKSIALAAALVPVTACGDKRCAEQHVGFQVTQPDIPVRVSAQLETSEPGLNRAEVEVGFDTMVASEEPIGLAVTARNLWFIWHDIDLAWTKYAYDRRSEHFEIELLRLDSDPSVTVEGDVTVKMNSSPRATCSIELLVD